MPDHSLIAVLLLMLLGTSIVVGTFFAFLIGHWVAERRSRIQNSIFNSKRESFEATRPIFFDRPNRWLAVRSSEVGDVQAALGLHNPSPCNWSEGLGRVSEGKLFISPPVQGWIMVFGLSLPDPSEDPDLCFHFVLKISRQLGAVQYFSVNRPVNHHAWVRVENGQIYRAYAWAGETVWNQGEMTGIERELGLKCLDYGEAPTVFPFSAREAHFANGEKIFLLAARWSLDPASLPDNLTVPTFGISGELAPSKIG